MGAKVDREAVANLVLPQLWSFSMGPLLSVEQVRSQSYSLSTLSVRYAEPDCVLCRSLAASWRRSRRSGLASSRSTSSICVSGSGSRARRPRSIRRRADRPTAARCRQTLRSTLRRSLRARTAVRAARRRLLLRPRSTLGAQIRGTLYLYVANQLFFLRTVADANARVPQTPAPAPAPTVRASASPMQPTMNAGSSRLGARPVPAANFNASSFIQAPLSPATARPAPPTAAPARSAFPPLSPTSSAPPPAFSTFGAPPWPKTLPLPLTASGPNYSISMSPSLPSPRPSVSHASPAPALRPKPAAPPGYSAGLLQPTSTATRPPPATSNAGLEFDPFA